MQSDGDDDSDDSDDNGDDNGDEEEDKDVRKIARTACISKKVVIRGGSFGRLLSWNFTKFCHSININITLPVFFLFFLPFSYHSLPHPTFFNHLFPHIFHLLST